MSDERQEWMNDPRGPVLLPLNGLHDHPYGEVANQHAYGPGNPPPESEPTIHSQEEFLTALDILLDHTLHADECYIDAAQTECVCVIGKVRAALPPCGATKWPAFAEPPRALKCVRNAHPASPDRHTFG